LQALKPYRFKYMPFLNGYRALAVLLVLVQHGLGPFSDWCFGKGCWTCMDMFFLLTGFLIGSLLVQEIADNGKVNLFKFYARRTLRIWPGHFAFLALTILLNPYDCKTMLIPALCTATFISDYATAFNWGGIILSGLVQTWSISVEEKFYAISPFLLSISRRCLKWVLIAGIAADELWKVFLIAQNSPWVRLEACFDTQLDSLMIGVLTGVLLSEQRTREWLQQKLSATFLPITLALAAVFFNSKLDHPGILQGTAANMLLWSVYLPAYKLILAALICCLCFHRQSIVTKVLELGPLQWIGTISYGIYLWHTFAFRFVGRQLIFWVVPLMPAWLASPQNIPYIIEVLKLVVALAFGAISFYGLENPFLQLKARFKPARLKPEVGTELNNAEATAERLFLVH